MREGKRIPQIGHGDSTFALWKNPYGFVAERCHELDSDIFQTRILLAPTICMTGPEAAQVFYDVQRAQRAGAAPEPIKATLFGKRAVQGLDGAAHVARKALFMKVLQPEAVAALADEVERQWTDAVATWNVGTPVRLYEAIQSVLSRAVCKWAGVPLPEGDVEVRTRDLVALFDDAARGVGSHIRARRARKRLELWLTSVIEDVRAKRYQAPDGSALAEVAGHHSADGRPLDARVAAVELLNLLRPTVAVSVYIVFVAHALLTHPQMRTTLRDADGRNRHSFLQEVRRFYPFFPAVVARVKEDFVWNDYYFPKGQRLLLDIRGTNQDERAWPAPHQFDPQRFIDQQPTPFNFIPQGGSSAASQHRCPGEAVTLAVMEVALDFLVKRLDYRNDYDDLGVDTGRIPALPRRPITLTLISPEGG